MAAINIDGLTLHSLLKLPFTYSDYKKLNGEEQKFLQSNFKNLKFFIIDEMSMIGARMLFVIEQRCREIFPDCNELFGGLNIYLLGNYLIIKLIIIKLVIIKCNY